MGIFEKVRGYIWDAAEGKYVLAPEPVTTDAGGNKRDYGVVYDDRGIGYRVGWPGERIARSKPPTDWAEKAAQSSPYNADELRALYDGRSWLPKD